MKDLPETVKQDILATVAEFRDIFAFSTEEMPVVFEPFSSGLLLKHILKFRIDFKSRLLFKESLLQVRRHSGQHDAFDIPIGTLPSVKDSLSDLLIGSVGHFLIKDVFLLLLH